MNKPKRIPKYPAIEHIEDNVFERVYKPSSDTLLLSDAIDDDIERILQLCPSTIMEVGSGSGYNLASMSLALNRLSSNKCLNVLIMGTDINMQAVVVTRETVLLNSVLLSGKSIEPRPSTFFRADLFGPVRPGTLDLVIFNPPYVTTPSEEIAPGIQASWAGGDFGSEVIRRFSLRLPEVLSERGICYLLLSDENRPELLLSEAFSSFDTKLIKSRSGFGESLSVYRLERK